MAGAFYACCEPVTEVSLRVVSALPHFCPPERLSCSGVGVPFLSFLILPIFNLGFSIGV